MRDSEGMRGRGDKDQGDERDQGCRGGEGMRRSEGVRSDARNISVVQVAISYSKMGGPQRRTAPCQLFLSRLIGRHAASPGCTIQVNLRQATPTTPQAKQRVAAAIATTLAVVMMATKTLHATVSAPAIIQQTQALM